MATNEYPGLNPQPSPLPGEPIKPQVPPLSSPQPEPQVPRPAQPETLGATQVPPPPSTESQVGVRTMSGDVSSLNSAGGETQQPKTFKPKDLIGGEPVFKPGAVPTAQPQTVHKTSHTKVLILAAVGAIVAIGLALAAFFLAPGFFREQEPTPPPVVNVTAVLSATPSTINPGEPVLLIWETTNATEATIDGIGAVELNGSMEVFTDVTTTYHLTATGESGTATDSKEVIVNTPVTILPFEHKSMFSSASAVASVPVVVSVSSPAGFNSALNTAMTSDTPPVFKEALPQDSVNAALDAYAFLPLFMPGLSREYLTATIERDFTAFVYKDSKGTWPGYAVKLNSTVPPPTTDENGAPVQSPAVTADATELLNAIKALPTVFYVEDPGAPKSANFADGAKFNASIQTIQFLAYTKSGASFNVATIKKGDDSYIVWSTSFNGIKEAVKLFGF